MVTARWQHFMSQAEMTGIASHPASTATIEIDINRFIAKIPAIRSACRTNQ
jgi:hypothetical protein